MQLPFEPNSNIIGSPSFPLLISFVNNSGAIDAVLQYLASIYIFGNRAYKSFAEFSITESPIATAVIFVITSASLVSSELIS